MDGKLQRNYRRITGEIRYPNNTLLVIYHTMGSNMSHNLNGHKGGLADGNKWKQNKEWGYGVSVKKK